MDLTIEALDLTWDRGLLLLAFTADPGSASHDGPQLLASSAATNPVDAARIPYCPYRLPYRLPVPNARGDARATAGAGDGS